jgi:hypothetical protein
MENLEKREVYEFAADLRADSYFQKKLRWPAGYSTNAFDNNEYA